MIVKDHYMVTVRKGGFRFIAKSFERFPEADDFYNKMLRSYNVKGLFVKEAVIKLWVCKKAEKLKR